MPTIKQLPLATQIAAADKVPLSQGNFTHSTTVGLLLAGTQPSITLAPGALLGRVSPNVGGPEPVAIGVGLGVSAGGLAATGADHVAFPSAPALSAGDEVVLNSGLAPRRMPATALRALFSAGVGVQIDAAGVISAPSNGGLGMPGIQGNTGAAGAQGATGAQGPKGDAGAAASAITDASALPVIARGTVTARSLGARAADRLNAQDFGAALDDTTDDTAALIAARGAAGTRPVTLPLGVARVTVATEGLSGRMDGDGQVRTADGHKRAPRFSLRSTEPTSYGNQGDIVQAFDGDLSTVHLAIEHRIEGDATLTKPATDYVMHHENSAISLSMLNQSGWNQATDDQTGGRTGVSAVNSSIGNTGQGDVYFLHVGGFVSGTKPGSTHFLANPAVLAFSGGFFSFSDGTYQEVDEFSHDDGGFGAVGSDIAVSSTVRNFNRSNDTGAKGAWWLAFRLQSAGTKAVDVALQPTGKWNNVIDTTAVTAGPSKAVWTQAAGQRTYLNASAFPDGFSNPAKVSFGTTYTHYNPATAAYEVVVGGTTALSVSPGGVLGITPAAGSNDATLATTAFVVARVGSGVGAAGPAGAIGATGAQGPAGAAGMTGATGAAGQGFNARGAWAATTAYAPNDIVTYGGQTYQASTAFTSGPVFNPATWNLWAAAGAIGPAGPAGSQQTTAATSSAIGSVKPDGATLTVAGDGTLSVNLVPVASGGTGALTAVAARSNLGLGTAAVLNAGNTAGTLADGGIVAGHTAAIAARLAVASNLSDVASPGLARVNVNRGVVTLTSAAAIATDCSTGNLFTLTLGVSATLSNPANIAAGASYAWRIMQDGSGSRTLAFGAAFRWPGGSAGVLSTAAGAVDVLAAVSFDGTTLDAVLTRAFA